MVKIRLSRVGVKKRHSYHIVVTDSRNPRDGRFIECIGFFNPIKYKNDKKSLSINIDRINHWTSLGAKLSNRVSYLIKNKYS